MLSDIGRFKSYIFVPRPTTICSSRDGVIHRLKPEQTGLADAIDRCSAP